MINNIIKPLSEVKRDYNFLMGYHTGIPKMWYCGIEGITFIYMGDWNDPLIGYKDYAINEPYAIDGFWSEYQEETKRSDYDEFAVWLKEHKELLFDSLDDIINTYRNMEKSA